MTVREKLTAMFVARGLDAARAEDEVAYIVAHPFPAMDMTGTWDEPAEEQGPKLFTLLLTLMREETFVEIYGYPSR